MAAQVPAEVNRSYSSDSVSEHSPGQISATVVTDTELNSTLPKEPHAERVEEVQRHILNRELGVVKEVNSIRDMKLVRFGVPYVQGEVQSLVPKKEWEDRVAHLETLLDEAKAENNRLAKIVLENESTVLEVRNECEKKLLDMKRALDTAESQNQAFRDKTKQLEKDKEDQVKLVNDLIGRHKIELSSLRSLIQLHASRSEELAKELAARKEENEELVLKSSRLMVKLEETELAIARVERRYEEMIARLTEEKRLAIEAAREQREKLLDSVAENEENVGRHSQYLKKSKELKEKIKKLEASITSLEEENNELKATIEVLNNKINAVKAHNESLIRQIESQPEVDEVKKEKEEEEEKEVWPVQGPPSSIAIEASRLEHSESKRSEVHIRQREEVKKSVTQVHVEKDISYQERNILTRQLFEERAKSGKLLKDFQMYKLKAKSESEEAERAIKKMQSQMWNKDVELQKLKKEMRALKENIAKTKDVHYMNSYLRDLPTSELWLHDEPRKSSNDKKQAVSQINESEARQYKKTLKRDHAKRKGDEVESGIPESEATLKKYY